ncbi:MAG: gas vesicle protein GvpO [Patescibacteria group bacterium]
MPIPTAQPGTLQQVIKEIVKFFKETLGADAAVIKTGKASDGGWEAQAEVIETSAHMKKVGVSKPVYDKNFYQISLDKNLNVTSYERKSQTGRSEA